MKDVERVNALNKMLLNANVVAYGAMVDLIKRTGRLDLDMDSGTHVDDCIDVDRKDDIDVIYKEVKRS